MQNSAALQLNIPSYANTTRFYIEWTGKKDAETGVAQNPAFEVTTEGKLTSTMLGMLSEIHTGSSGYKKPKKMKYKYFQTKLGLSKDTVYKNLKELKRRGLIKNVGRSRYCVVPDTLKTNYIIIDDFLYITDWKVKETIRRLTFNAIFVLEYIISMHKYCKEHLGKPFIASQTKIAKGLNFAPSTVADAITVLKDAGLITRHKATPEDGYEDTLADTKFYVNEEEDGAGDGYSLSAYIPNPKLLEVKHPEGRAAAPAAKQQSTSTSETSAQPRLKTVKKHDKAILADANNHFDKLHTIAVNLALNAEETAERDAEYKKLNSELLDLTFQEVGIKKRQIPEALIPVRKAELEKKRSKRLRELGIGKYQAPDFKPIYHCQLCEDTGRRVDTGQLCKCYHQYLKSKGYKLRQEK